MVTRTMRNPFIYSNMHNSQNINPAESYGIVLNRDSHQNTINSVGMPLFLGQAQDLVCSLSFDLSNEDSSRVNIYREQLLANRFLIKSLLGKGSFGQVLKTFDIVSNRFYAIKILNPTKNSLTIQTEVAALKLLNRTNTDLVVHLFGHFVWQGFHCLVFELLGENLYDYLKNKTNFTGMSIDEVGCVACQLVYALSRLSALNIIHCDIKPENIAIYDANGRKRIKLIDFGSSSVGGKIYYRYIQSRFYRALEVILELGYGLAIDTWSVGCVLVELLTGVPLFPGCNELDQLGLFTQVLGPLPNALTCVSPKFDSFFSLENNKIVLKVNNPPKRASTAVQLEVTIANCPNVCNKLMNSPCALTSQKIVWFIDLVSKMLRYDTQTRIKPHQALSHIFIVNACSDLLSLKHQPSQPSHYQMGTGSSDTSFCLSSVALQKSAPSIVGSSMFGPSVCYQDSVPNVLHPPNSTCVLNYTLNQNFCPTAQTESINSGVLSVVNSSSMHVTPHFGAPFSGVCACEGCTASLCNVSNFDYYLNSHQDSNIRLLY